MRFARDRTLFRPELGCGSAFCVLALAMCAAAPAAAQNFQQVAPKPVPLPSGPLPEIVVPPLLPPEVLGPDEQQLLPELKGLVLVDTAAKIMAEGASTPGISIENLPLADAAELRAQLSAFLGKQVTFGDLTRISQTIVAWYRARNHPFVDVVFPAQDINTGVVQAVVTEFHLGEVRVTGNRWFSADLLRNYIRARSGDALDLTRLNEDLTALNQNPFRKVNVVAQKSEMVGATDLELQTEDRFPLRVYGGYDNSGTAALGFDRWNLGANWGNAFGLDQQISYQFTSSSDFWEHFGGSTRPGLTAHSLNWLAPLPWRDRLAIFGSYSESRPRLGPDLGLTGVAAQASARYIANLPAIDLSFIVPGLQAGEDLQAGFDFKSTNNNLSFGGEEVSNVTTEVDQFPLTWDLSLETIFGQTAVSNTLVWSPGNLTAQNRDIFFQQQANNPYAAANYVYDTLNLTHTAPLPFGASWVTRVQAQIADHNLLPSEQLGAGGATSVRGYRERTANGSEGVVLSEELRSPPFAPLARFLPPEFADQMQLVVFWDYGTVREVHPVEGTPASIQLSGAGGGLRYLLSRFVDVRLDYGHQLLKAPGATTLDNVLHVSVTVGN